MHKARWCHHASALNFQICFSPFSLFWATLQIQAVVICSGILCLNCNSNLVKVSQAGAAYYPSSRNRWRFFFEKFKVLHYKQVSCTSCTCAKAIVKRMCIHLYWRNASNTYGSWDSALSIKCAMLILSKQFSFEFTLCVFLHHTVS